MPVAVLDVDLYRDTQDVRVEARYEAALVLIRWRGVPLGQLRARISDGQVSMATLWANARETFGESLKSCVADAVVFGGATAATRQPEERRSCSVIVCTRNRPDDLRRCLDALQRSSPRPTEIIVVDNAPPDDATERVAAEYPVRYVVERRQGLNWARTHGAGIAASELLLYTDDDVVVDPGWVGAMCEPFADPQVGAVTGLVLALELETPTQQAFEHYAGFSRGFRSRRFTIGNTTPAAAGKAGAGASMALRRDLVTSLGLFECELDCGTAALSGGDNYAFYLVLKNGYAIFYTPLAVCWHRHRRTEPELLATLYGYSVGVYSMLLRCVEDHRDWNAMHVGASWFASHHARNALRGALRRPGAAPWRFTAAEIRGVLASYRIYRKTRRVEREMKRLASIRETA